MQAQLFTLGVFLCLLHHADFAGKFAAPQGAQTADESAHTAEILCVRCSLPGRGSSSGAKDASWTSLAVPSATSGRATAPTTGSNHGDASVEVHYLSGDEQGRLYPLSLVWRTLETSCGTKSAAGLQRQPAVDETTAVTAKITEVAETAAPTSPRRQGQRQASGRTAKRRALCLDSPDTAVEAQCGSQAFHRTAGGGRQDTRTSWSSAFCLWTTSDATYSGGSNGEDGGRSGTSPHADPPHPDYSAGGSQEAATGNESKSTCPGASLGGPCRPVLCLNLLFI